MAGFLHRLQKRRGAGKALQAEDIVVRDKGAATTKTSLKSNPKKRARTSVLLTSREPSPEGLLAELVGLRGDRKKGDARAVLEPERAGLQGAQVPPWLNTPSRTAPQLDVLVPAARLVLYEFFADDYKSGDVLTTIKRAVTTAAHRLSAENHFTSRDIQQAIQELHGLIAGKGPLQPLYEDPFVTDIYIDAHDRIRCLRLGQALETPFRFRSPVEYEAFYTSLLESAGRVLSSRVPVIDCVLKDDWRSRVNAVHGSLREGGEPSLVIRVPRLRYATLYDLLRSHTLPASLAAWLSELVAFGESNILIMGPTGSGKTTLAAALLSAVGSDERICTIEDIPEIFVANCHLEKLVTRAADSRGEGAVEVDQLLRAALHRAPHRIVMGEIRDREGHLFLHALETGHSGSIATMHADNPVEGLWRLLDVVSTYERAPLEVVQRRISRLINIIIVLQRVEGRPCIVEVAELLPFTDGEIPVKTLVKYEGERKGRRVWRRCVSESPLIRVMCDRGVDLTPGPTLLPPPELDAEIETERA